MNNYVNASVAPQSGIHIDAANMPPSLSLPFFADWLQKFNQLLSKIGLPIWDFSEAKINVVFSDKEKTASYGTMSLEKVKERIREKWKMNKLAEEILSQITDADIDGRRELSSQLAEILCGDNPESYSEIREALDELFGRICFVERVLGEYSHKERSIVLYTKNIECTAIGNRTIAQNYELTLIHELFHAYHYHDSRQEICRRWDYTSTVVKESLAAAFEWSYCVEHKIAGDMELRLKWQRHSVVAYPYSGALYLLDDCMQELEAAMFRGIFKRSLVDMDGALRVLIPPSIYPIFYDIKNLVCCRETEPATADLRKAFDRLMRQDEIGIVARREIPSIIKKKPQLIRLLLDLNYSYAHFHATQYPILATSPMVDNSGKARSYSAPVYSTKTKAYYMTNQWDKRQFDLLLDWIWVHR